MIFKLTKGRQGLWQSGSDLSHQSDQSLLTWTQDTMSVREKIYKWPISLSLLIQGNKSPLFGSLKNSEIRTPAVTPSTISPVIQAKFLIINLNYTLFFTSWPFPIFYQSPSPKVLSPRYFSIHPFLSISPTWFLHRALIILCQHYSNNPLILLSDLSLVLSLI